MDNLLYELSLFRQHPYTLTQQQIKNIDDLTHSYKDCFNSAEYQNIENLWAIISQFQLFWENIGMLFTQTTKTETRLQILITIHQRVKFYWNLDDEEKKNSFKTFISQYIKQFNSQTIRTEEKVHFRKINDILVEILKYEWKGQLKYFITHICTQTMETPLTAQNYFDLLKCIFRDIFGQKTRLITSCERCQLLQIIVEHQHIIHKLFSEYLELNKHQNKNLLFHLFDALESILEHLSSYYIYTGFILDKLVFYIGSQFSQHVLNCLKVIFEKSDDANSHQMEKIQNKKLKVIYRILEVTRQILFKNKLSSLQENIIQIIYIYLVKNPSKIPLLKGQEQEISQKVSQWFLSTLQTQKNNSSVQNRQTIAILSCIISKVNKKFSQSIVKYVILLAPCPRKFANFYKIENVFDEDYFSVEDGDQGQSEQQYIKLIRLLIDHFKEQLYNYFSNYSFFPQRIEDLRLLCRQAWFMHYLCQEDFPLVIKNVHLIFLKNCLQLEKEIKKFFHQTFHNKQIQHTFKHNPDPQVLKLSLTCIRSFILMILHKQVKRDVHRKELFKKMIIQNFAETQSLISFGFIVLKQSTKYLSQEDMGNLTNEFEKTINYFDSKYKMEFSEKYIEVVSRWAQQFPQKSHSMNFLKTIIDKNYKKFQQILKLNVRSSQILSNSIQSLFDQSNQDLQVYKELSQIGKYLLKLFTILLPSTRSYIYQSYQNLFVALEFTFVRLWKFPKYLDFCESYVEFQTVIVQEFFFQSQVNLVKKHIEVFLKIHESNLKQQIFQYFMAFMSHDSSNSLYAELIVENIMNTYFSLQEDQNLTFLEHVIDSKSFLLMSQKAIGQIVYKVQEVCMHGKNYVSRYYGLLSKILMSMEEKQTYEDIRVIWQYFLEIVIHTFKLLLKNLQTFCYQEQICQVMELQIKMTQISNNNFPIKVGNTDNNLQIVHISIMTEIQSFYPGESNLKLREAISGELNSIFHQNKKGEISRKISDLIIVLQRGYI